MSRLDLVIRYVVFALLATAANLLSQRAVLALITVNDTLVLAIGVGTAVGLVVKYALDKKWIFNDQSTGLKTHGVKFGLYTIMGVFTTAIFWGFETGFWLIWETDLMREIGAVSGLGIGYIIKYQLDRKYVFQSAAA
jgi:putative flippase GtrA